MTSLHRVRSGDCISSIAFDHGFYPDTIWMHPQNEALRRIRANPNVLLEGDVVFVPERQPKCHRCRTDGRHVFRRKGVPEKLRLRLLSHGRPRSNIRLRLEIEGVQIESATDKEGVVTVPIIPNARRGRLSVLDTGEEYVLELGALDPAAVLTGIQARLRNLGYYKGAVNGVHDPSTAESLKKFLMDSEATAGIGDAPNAAQELDLRSRVR